MRARLPSYCIFIQATKTGHRNSEVTLKMMNYDEPVALYSGKKKIPYPKPMFRNKNNIKNWGAQLRKKQSRF